ncbi:MAG: CAP domain-containing protein [Longimicrobiales bacterium]|nr:CAP domain-containing protein [Longimicrobiales bacterium]
MAKHAAVSRLLRVALAALVVGSPGGTSAAQEHCPSTPGQRTLDLVNEERRLHALPALEADTMLSWAARLHAEDMARRGTVSHQGSDGSDPSQRVTAVGYSWIWVGENIAAGQSSPDEVVAGWRRSEAHRSNILGPDFTSAGVAHAESSVGEFGTYWVMVYAAADPPSAAVVRCHP